MKKVLACIIIACSFITSGCSDAEQARWKAIGDPGDIECYSGGVLIYSGRSTGKIYSEEHSDGWYLNDSKTNRLVRVSGDCVIKN